MLRASWRILANFKMEEIMAQNSRAKRSEKELLTLTLASGVTIPDSKMAREVTELVRDTENSLLFNHSSRVYYFSAATGRRKGLTFDPELLYVSAMFHDMGLTPEHSSATDRFEVDGANTLVSFFVSTRSPNKTPTQCGLRLPFTPHPVSLSTCILWLRY